MDENRIDYTNLQNLKPYKNIAIETLKAALIGGAVGAVAPFILPDSAGKMVIGKNAEYINTKAMMPKEKSLAFLIQSVSIGAICFGIYGILDTKRYNDKQEIKTHVENVIQRRIDNTDNSKGI